MTIKDRVEIAAGLKAGWTPARIVRDLGRDRSVITREIARNSTKTCGYRVVSGREGRAARQAAAGIDEHTWRATEPPIPQAGPDL